MGRTCRERAERIAVRTTEGMIAPGEAGEELRRANRERLKSLLK